MKHLIKDAFALLAAAVLLAACLEKESALNGFFVDRDEITIGAEGGTETLVVSSSVEWTVSSSQPWISVSPANGMGNVVCKVSIDTTLMVGMREGTITFAPKGFSSQAVDVHQTGYGNIISLRDTEVSIPASANYDDRYFETQVTANVDFDILVEYLPIEGVETTTFREWVSPPNVKIDLDRGARPRTMKLRFGWSMNTYWAERAAKITFVPCGEYEGAELVEDATMILYQGAAPEITDDRAGDSLAIISIWEQLNMSSILDASENLRNWSGVTLWEKTDKDLPLDENGQAITDAIGRVRAVSFNFFNTQETVPQEIKYLKYVEKVSFFSNVNSYLKKIDLDSDICELQYLRDLEIGAFGLVSLPDDFNRLSQLESLDLGNNNFDHIPDVLTPENFPDLRSISFLGNRTWSVTSLQNSVNYDDGLGLMIHMEKDAAAEGIRRLFLWENLESLALNYNYLEGSLPTFEVGSVVDGKTMIPFIEGTDFTELRDTVSWLWTMEGQKIPRILPNCKSLKINLNFFTGNAPDWIMYHPYLIDWIPDTFIFNQQEEGKDSAGKEVKFDNAPNSYTYYYNVYPLYESKYAISDEHD